MTFLEAWLRAFLVTLAVECAVMALLPLRAPSFGRRLASTLYVNLASHPLLWLVAGSIEWGAPRTVVLAELWAFGSEVLGYRLIWGEAGPWRRAAWVSAALNACSYLAGVGMRAAGLGV